MKISTILSELKVPAIVFLVQFLLSDLLSIKGIRPDFILIYIIYSSIARGSFHGVIAGFILGLLVDLSGVGTYFGLSSVLYVLAGYAGGYLKGQFNRMHPTIFHSSWIGLLLFIFFISCFIRFNILYETDMAGFLTLWIYSSGYTLGMLALLQFLIPVNEG